MTDADVFTLKMAAAGASGFLEGLLECDAIKDCHRSTCERLISELRSAIWPELSTARMEDVLTREAGSVEQAPAAIR